MRKTNRKTNRENKGLDNKNNEENSNILLNFKRLFSILKGHYRYIVLSIIMILIIQALELISPILVKNVLDEGLSGVEYPWVIVEKLDDKTIEFNNRFYKQQRHLDEDDIIVGDASIVIIGKDYYLVNDKVVTGINEIVDGKLIVKVKVEDSLNGTITYDTKIYETIKIAKDDVKTFYNPVMSIIWLSIILITIKTIVSIIVSYIHRISNNKVISYLAKEGRTRAFKAIERLPLSEFESEPAGKTASRITHDVDGIINLYRLTINVFLNAILSFVFAYVGMFYLDPLLALLSFIIYPFAYIWIKIYLRKLKNIAEKVNESRSMITAKTNEIINGINILQIFNFKNHTINEFNDISTVYKDEQLKEVKLHIIGGWNLLNVLRAVITVAIVAFFGIQKLSVGEIVITAGLIYAYNEYLLKIVNPISILLNQVSTFEHSNVQMNRIYKIIDGIQESDEKHPIPRYQGNIRFDNVWFSYVDDEFVLKGVSFDVKAGQMVGLVGHTGSGKSSLMNLLLRFYDLKDHIIKDPIMDIVNAETKQVDNNLKLANSDLRLSKDKKIIKSGHIYLDGQDINTLSKRTYREHIGIVLQEPILFRGTIASNIKFGKNGVSDQEVESVLIQMGGEKLINKFKDGIHTKITRAGNNMSAGEKQIISLARAIIQDPSILIMDEATSHIDIETETIIKKGLEIVCKNRTVIVIAHRLSTIFDADNIIVLEHGLKVEEGNHEELMKKNGVYANIYNAQITGTIKSDF